ncbi:DNA-binding protein [uncultured Fusobacterium sp.]|uniref:DNA-binding protein n=1 Tax=uncultured Fusobacterium sp. TaxID=159267 RepID=UPI0025CE93E0|nr:DNA-binding protein [uncultured Fusobacterium sp.]
MGRENELKSKIEYQKECEEYLKKKLDKLPEFEKQLMEELEEKYGLWVTVEKAMKILGKSRSTIYKYKDDNAFIYRQNERKIMIYTKSLILVL